MIGRDHTLREVTATFVRLADTLTDDYDVVDFVAMFSQEGVRLLDNDAAGVMLASSTGELRILAATDETARRVEQLQLDTGEGPTLDAFRTGETLDIVDLADSTAQWPRFAPGAVEKGFRAMSAIPMVVRGDRIGVLNLFNREPCVVPPAMLALAEGLATIAGIGILSARKMRHRRAVTEQLQRALDSRVVLEQAKGKVSQCLGMHVDDAFTILRGHARARRTHLSDVARDVVAGRIEPHELDRTPIGESGIGP